MTKRLVDYLNPITKLGKRQYSALFPFLATTVVYILSEAYTYLIVKDSMTVGNYVIFLSVALIIYFAFRDGIVGGFMATCLTILYYVYIIYSRHYSPAQLDAGLRTTLVLAVLFFILSGIIGWLKQTIDHLIEREADEKRRLEVIIQQLPVGVIITNEKGIVTQTNKQVDSLIGAKIPDGFILGKDPNPANSKLKGKTSLLNQSPLLQALSSGKTIVGREFSIEKEGGREATLQVDASPIRNNHGKIIAAASIINDITPLKELDKRKDDFVNMASHELKTPLTSLKLYQDSLRILLRRYRDPDAVKLLNNIKYQTGRLQQLVNDLLDVSKIQTGKLTFSKEEFMIDSLIKETIEGLKATAKDRQISLKGSPAKVSADKFRIYQVLTNLVTNAIKYSPPGSDINISVKKDKNSVLISVQDFGIGITKSQQKKIFDRLYQVSASPGENPSGFGMGLFIAQEIIKRHKGSIWVESEKGKGSTFFFSLPLAKKR